MKENLNRRTFLKGMAVVAAGSALAPSSLAFAASSQKQSPYGTTIDFTFNSQKKFRVMQITDTHFIPNDSRSDRALTNVCSMLDTEKPDLVIHTGDIIYCAPAKNALKAIFAPMAERKIPWAVALGNHDGQFDLNRKDLFDYIRTLPYNVNQPQKTGVTGDSNDLITISTSEGKVQWALYLMDTGDRYKDDYINCWGSLAFDQVEWYRNESARLAKENGGKPVQALAFMHIPVCEFDTSLKDANHQILGNQKEAICCPEVNCGMYVAAHEVGDIKAYVSGHDHDNDFNIKWRGTHFIYGRFSGGDTEYNNLKPNGCRMFEFTQDTERVRTYVRLYGGAIEQLSMVPATEKEEDPSASYGTELILEAGQLSSNASDTEEGAHLEYLIDKKENTYWHSDKHNQCSDTYHYLQVALKEEFCGDMTLMMTRSLCTNDHPTQMLVWGSTDGVNYEELGSLKLPFEGEGTVATASILINNPVRFVRFAATDCSGEEGFRTYWHAAEFHLYGITAKADLADIVFNAGGTATDVSAMHHTVRKTGTPKVVKDNELGRYVLDQSNLSWGSSPTSFFSFPVSDELWSAMSDGFSMECYVCPQWKGSNSTWISVFGYEQGGGVGMITDGGKWCFESHVGGSYKGAYGPVPVNNKWIHLVGVWNKSLGKSFLYVDGKLAGTAAASGSLAKPGLNQGVKGYFHLGCDIESGGTASNVFQGKVAIMRLYNSPLTEGIVAQLYQNTQETSVQGVKASSFSEEGIYTLDGVKHKEAQKGVNIVDGQKILVK